MIWPIGWWINNNNKVWRGMVSLIHTVLHAGMRASPKCGPCVLGTGQEIPVVSGQDRGGQRYRDH